MATIDTAPLYKELRAALLSRDDVAAMNVLRRIVAINPQDASAARQLAELSAKGKPAAPGTKPGPNAITRELYKKYRTACLAHNDTEAFEILEKIIQLDSLDDDAKRQRTEVGKRIASSLEQQLQAAMESGEINQISAVVKKMRSYAADEILMNIGDFAAALSLYQADKNKQLQKQIAEFVAEMSLLTDVEEKQKKALFIERFACDNGVAINSSHASILKQVHDAWKELQQLREQEQQFDELSDEYARIRDLVREQTDLPACRDALMQLRTKVSQLTKLDEHALETFLKRVDLSLEKIRRIRAAAIRKKVLKSALSSMASIVGVSSIVLYGYAHSTADERCAEFVNAVKAKDVKSAQLLLDGIYIMEPIYKLVSSDYDIILNKTREWVHTYHQQVDKLKQYKQWLTQHRNHDSESLVGYLKNHVDPACQMLEKLKVEYQYNPPEDLFRLHQEAINDIVGTLKYRYMQPPTGTDLHTLAKLYGEYQAYKGIIGFTAEEDATVRKTYLKLSEEILFLNLYSHEAIDNSLSLYHQYKQVLPLTEDVVTRLNDYRKNLEAYTNLPSLLASSTGLKDYISKLKQAQSLLQTASVDVPMKQLEALQSELPTMKTRLYLKKHGINITNTDEMKQKFTLARKAYVGDGSFFPSYAEADLVRLTNMLTDHRGPAWSNDYEQLIEKGKVLIGKIAQVNNHLYFRQYLAGDKMSKEKKTLANLTNVRSLNMSRLSRELSIDRHALLRGKTRPTKLMHTIASSVMDDASPMANAYLFSLTLDLLKSVHEIENGVCFSKSLQQDMAEWEKLKSWLRGKGVHMNDKCWMNPHPLEAQTKIKRFLRGVSGNDYEAEIRDCLAKLENSDCVLVGYFAPSGQMVNIIPADNRKLYYVSNDTLVPYQGKAGTPFMPILSVDVD